MLHTQPMLLLIAALGLAAFIGIIVFFSRGSERKAPAEPPQKTPRRSTRHLLRRERRHHRRRPHRLDHHLERALTDAWLTPGTLNLRFYRTVASRTGNSTVIDTRSAPLPPSPTADLQLLQAHLITKCPGANIALA